MTPAQKTEVIELLKEKFSQYSNFYVTDTESLTVEQVSTLRRVCFEKNVEMKVAKNTLIKKALESLGDEKYAGIYDSLHNVTALMFSDSPKEPAVIISAFRKGNNSAMPILKAALIGEEVYSGDDKLVALTNIKTKNELIGEVIGLLQSPAKRVISAMLNHIENGSSAPAATEAVAAAPEEAPEVAPEVAPEAAPEEAPATPAEAAPEAPAEEATPAAE
jgi:large subunit ribosomal protein L10